MSDSKLKIGSIGWIDLTVDNATQVRDFYADVVGWTPADVDMDGYADFMMSPPDGDPVSGVCHARGSNTNLPVAWLIYIVVADIDRSIERCNKNGGKVISGPRNIGNARFCVIRDPAGAHCALYQA